MVRVVILCVAVFVCSMACISPLTAYYAKERNPSGKRSLVFDSKASHSGVPIEIGCASVRRVVLRRPLMAPFVVIMRVSLMR